VAYLPARYFEVSHHERGAMRLSFAGLSPDEIRRGLAALGRVVAVASEGFAGEAEPAPAMV
jgi:DNA-binding transcriptional MocR family regulator